MNNAKQEQIISALLTYPTIKAVAEHLNISSTTIYSYLKDEEFKAKYYKAKGEILQQTTTYLQSRTSEAIKIIDDIAKDDTVNAQVRLSACRTMLEYSLKFTETNELIERISALENSIIEDN